MIDPQAKQLIEKGTIEFQQIQDLVEEIYQLGSLNRIYEIFGGYVNRSFGVEVTKADGKAMDYFVRRYRATTTDEDISFEHRIVTYAIEHGCDLAAGVMKTPTGETFVKIPWKTEEATLVYPWAISEYLYGEDPYDWVNNELKPGEYASMARALARFHASSKGFEGGVKSEPQIYKFLDVKKDYFIHLFDGKPVSKMDCYVNSYNKHLNYVLSMCDKARKGMADSGMHEEGKGTKVACHSDYHVSNVKWKDGECCGIFDFDWTKEDYRLGDIGYSLTISIASWDAMEDGTIDLKKVRAYMKGYCDATKEIDVLPELSAEEKKAFPYMVLAGAIYLFHWSTDYAHDWENLNNFEYAYYVNHLIKTIHFVEDHIDDLYQLICSL
jgi:homoserine kinase type II